MGLKIGTHPTALLSQMAAGIRAGLAPLASGAADAPGALSPAEFRTVMGYGDYDREAKLLIS